jgi:uncharacterized membrane protein HdeD (DUF308 family)
MGEGMYFLLVGVFLIVGSLVVRRYSSLSQVLMGQAYGFSPYPQET